MLASLLHRRALAPCAFSLPSLFATAASAPLGLPSSASAAVAAVSSPRSALGSLRFATSKAGGSTKNGRDSNPKFLGVKRYGGEYVQPGDIIIRQRGMKTGIVESTQTVGVGRDHTIFATQPGYVKFWRHDLKKKNFVEVVKSSPWAEKRAGGKVDKYPISKVDEWELPNLLKLPAVTPISDKVKQQLVSYLLSLPLPVRKGLVAPGSAVIGDVAAVIYAEEGAAAQAAAAASSQQQAAAGGAAAATAAPAS